MATHEVTIHPFPAQPLTITAKEISRYAELSALVSQLESQQKSLRSELLELHNAGAEQEETGPYLLSFVGQQRHQIDWQSEAMALAMRVYGTDQLTAWKTRLEQSAPVTSITQIRVKPNAAFAAALTKPAASVRSPLTPGPRSGLETDMDSPNDTDIDIHICPMCKKNIATGRDTRRLPALCTACEELDQLLAARFRLLPVPLLKLANTRKQRRRA